LYDIECAYVTNIFIEYKVEIMDTAGQVKDETRNIMRIGSKNA
jgi:hypothetical protein